MPYLVISLEGHGKAVHGFTRALVVGRKKPAKLRLPDSKISREHCRLEPSEHAWVVTDLGSSNGTFVNGERVTRRVLAEGDELRIGRASVVFHAGTPSGGDLEEAVCGLLTDAPRDEVPAERLEAMYEQAAADWRRIEAKLVKLRRRLERRARVLNEIAGVLGRPGVGGGVGAPAAIAGTIGATSVKAIPARTTEFRSGAAGHSSHPGQDRREDQEGARLTDRREVQAAGAGR